MKRWTSCIFDWFEELKAKPSPETTRLLSLLWLIMGKKLFSLAGHVKLVNNSQRLLLSATAVRRTIVLKERR
jgi:hypothetical protein